MSHYDADGNRKYTNTDNESWEETDTQHYHQDGPSQLVELGPSTPDNQIRQNSSAEENFMASDGKTVILSSSEVCDGPVVRWSDTAVDEESGETLDLKAKVKTDGCSWSRSEESVCISTSNKNPNFAASPLKAIKLDKSPSVENPLQMPLIGSVQNGEQIQTSQVGCIQNGDPVKQTSLLTKTNLKEANLSESHRSNKSNSDERRKKRRDEAAARRLQVFW